MSENSKRSMCPSAGAIKALTSTSLFEVSSQIVVVLGMHRSGTSAITHILTKAGFFAGEGPDLIQGNQWNRDGYFERWSVIKVNELILNLCNGSWHSPPEEDDILRISVDPKIESLLNLYRGRERVVIKDPRMCLTFPVWKRVLGENIGIVNITRKPTAVAASLQRRDGFPEQKSLLLWEIYNERASRYARSHPTFSMRYEDLLEEQRGEVLQQLASFLGVDRDLEEIAGNVIDPSLRHDEKEKPSISTPKAEEMYEEAIRSLNGGNVEAAVATLEKLVSSYPRHAVAHNDLGVLYYGRKDLERALSHLELSLHVDPNNATARKNYEKVDAELKKARGIISIAQETPALNVKGMNNTQRWWDYARLSHNTVKVLLVSLRHLLLSEIRGALRRLGHDCKVLLIGNEELDREAVEVMFNDAIRDFQPDFVLTVNHLGFDQEGVVTGLLTSYQIPFASWYVDSPHLIIRHYDQNTSPYLTLFLWDEDYIKIAKSLGFERVEYLPLGVDEKLFRPLGSGKNPLSHLSSGVSFVGNSMVYKVQAVLERNRINGALLTNFERVSQAFQDSHHLVVRDMMTELFPDLTTDMTRLSEPQALGYEAGVTWQATGWYRAELVKELIPFRPLIVGDGGWKEILGNDWQLHSELNYYDDLPFFYNATNVSFNATSRQMKNGVNQRVFDAPACKSAVITDWSSQLENLMEPGREVLAYKRGDEIPEMANRVLKDTQFRRRISECGHKRVLHEHTYCHRVRQLIEVMRRDYA